MILSTTNIIVLHHPTQQTTIMVFITSLCVHKRFCPHCSRPFKLNKQGTSKCLDTHIQQCATVKETPKVVKKEPTVPFQYTPAPSVEIAPAPAVEIAPTVHIGRRSKSVKAFNPGTPQERGFPKEWTGRTCAPTKKSQACMVVKVKGQRRQRLDFRSMETNDQGHFKCPHFSLCDYSHSKKNTLREHYEQHFEPSFTCLDCSGAWNLRTQYNQHFKERCDRGCGVIRKIGFNWEDHVCKPLRHHGVRVVVI